MNKGGQTGAILTQLHRKILMLERDKLAPMKGNHRNTPARKEIGIKCRFGNLLFYDRQRDDEAAILFLGNLA
jgi:hypothetical protein